MKTFMRIVYIVFVIVVSFVVYMFSIAKKFDTFYTESMTELNNNFDRDRYMAVVMTDEINITDYLIDPIYLAKNDEENNQYEVGLYQFYHYSNDKPYYFSMLYFKDLGIKKIEDLMNHPNYNRHYPLVKIKVEFYFDNNVEPIVDYIDVHYLDQRPLPFVLIDTNEENNLAYTYFENDEGERVRKEANTLSQVRIFIESKLDEVEELYEIVNLNHEEINNNEGINDVINKNVTNFNGDISYQDLANNYLDEELIGPFLMNEIDGYKYVSIRVNLVYYSILIVVTFLLFFFKPTYYYFYNKRLKK